jgi:uncharacterized protein YdeI (YjbR/CyaY-like superfamily)
MSDSTFNPKVDAYIAKSGAFAQPILEHLRALIHKACPPAVEEIKWSRPFFLHNAEILCNISAFKEHCAFGFWGAEIGKELTADGIVQDGGMGSLGKITTLKDLPSDKQMLAYIRRAAELIDSGNGENRVVAQRRVVKAPKAELEMSAEFAAALKKHKTAATHFDAFSPSCRREYIDWIADAKKPETRDRRIAQAIDWIAEGKQRNWKYQNC